jgi:quercetin dioxygenase-like cupin family protein
MLAERGEGMLFSGQAHTVFPGEGEVGDLGVVRMRVLAAGESTTNGSFSLLEFSGDHGPWTVPHLHRGMEESFYVLDGEFTFAVGDERITTEPGSYILIPRGTPHMLAAGAGGGRLLCFMVPGGLEEMFLELAQLPPDSITDSAARAAISARYDSIPIYVDEP